ncbi:MAG: 2-phosphosulfolactate phosphatase [Bacteroidetes bacterium]|nr:2-phosphosulfolactate phosphatase [Bacteroidota bacterium]
MKIKVRFSSSGIDELAMKDCNICVIDVFRSSTTIATALNNGAREVIPVGSIENAVKVSSSLMGEVVIRAGERGGKMIDGFNLGNSPAEFTEEAVKGKAIIYCTTNGTVTITKTRYAKKLIIGGFVNISAITNYIFSTNEDWEIICAGREEEFSIEDTVCAGMLINLLQNQNQFPLVLNDCALASLQLYKTYSKKINSLANISEHGKYLKTLGFENDLMFCLAIDSIPVIPIYSDNVIKLTKV